MNQVNHPPHYTYGKTEVIDVIESAVISAPNPICAGLHWNTLKYLLRLWHKECSLTDALKARWYLDRLIQKIEAAAKVE